MATEDIVNGSTSSQYDPSSSSIQESSSVAAATTSVSAEKKWPGWPGDCVFRVVIPVAKVGCIIGKKGELIKKMCEDTRAHILLLHSSLGTNDRIVLISSKKEPEARLSPDMNVVIRVFRRITGLSETDGEGSSFGENGGTVWTICTRTIFGQKVDHRLKSWETVVIILAIMLFVIAVGVKLYTMGICSGRKVVSSNQVEENKDVNVR